MFSFSSIARIGGAIALLALSSGASATLIGDTVTIGRYINGGIIGGGTCCGPTNVVVQAGTGDLTAVSTGNNLFVDVEANSVRFQFGPSGGSGGSIADHEILVEDLDWVGMPGAVISGISFTTNFASFDSSLLSFTDNSLSLQIGSLNFPGGQFVDVTFTTTGGQPVPAPASVALLALGLIGLRAMRRT